MPRSDTDTGADVTARALARVEDARKRAIWAADFVTLNADRRGKTRMEMREIRADLSTDSARAELASLVAAAPLLAAIAAAAVRLTLKAKASHDAALSDADAPWWSNDDMCIVCSADALSWRIIQHDDDCPALALDAAIRAAGGATP